jgi:excisionase family DNA binding protein
MGVEIKQELTTTIKPPPILLKPMDIKKMARVCPPGMYPEKRGAIVQALRIRDVAEILNVSAATVYQLCACGKLSHVRVGTGRGAIRIREEDLDAFIAAATVRPEELAAPRPPAIKLKHLKI